MDYSDYADEKLIKQVIRSLILFKDDQIFSTWN